jgi:hypothetical protein
VLFVDGAERKFTERLTVPVAAPADSLPDELLPVDPLPTVPLLDELSPDESLTVTYLGDKYPIWPSAFTLYQYALTLSNKVKGVPGFNVSYTVLCVDGAERRLTERSTEPVAAKTDVDKQSDKAVAATTVTIRFFIRSPPKVIVTLLGNRLQPTNAGNGWLERQ